MLAAIVGQASPVAVLLASTSENKEIAARLAFRIGSGLLADAVGIDDGAVVTSLTDNLYVRVVDVQADKSDDFTRNTTSLTKLAPELTLTLTCFSN